MKLRISSLAVLVVVFVAAGHASADPIYGTLVPSSDFSGSREDPTTLTGTGRFDNMDISWLITLNDGVYSYRYDFDFSPTRQNSISHLILDLSDNCIDSANQTACISNVRLNGGAISALTFGTFDPQASNPGFPAGQQIVGVKLDDIGEAGEPNIWTLTFDSQRAPMWADIYLKAGSNHYLFNNGLLAANRTSDDENLFIPLPDTVTVDPEEREQVPEPATGVLLVGGMLALLRSRRRQRRS